MKLIEVEPQTIHHSGKSFTSKTVTDGGYRVWPIEEFFARRPMKPEVQDRIKRLNPYGLLEGGIIRGFHLKRPGKRWLKKPDTRKGRDATFRHLSGW